MDTLANWFNALCACHVWLIAGIVLCIMELATPGAFFLLSLGVGALLASAGAFVGAGLTVQIVLFCVGTIAAFVGARAAIHRESKAGPKVLTNVDALAGKPGLVTEAIPGGLGKGRVKIEGEEWPAVMADSGALGAGAHVVVEKVDGNTLVVRPGP
jgi:membrane protein implicated in regulation of membrane protease activity